MSAHTEPQLANGASRTRLLEVENLHVEFRLRASTVYAVNGVSFGLDRGETLALLGESGCGKSISAQAVMGVIDSPPGFVTQGSVRYNGTELLTLPKAQHRKVLGERIAMVYQSASLNPSFTVGWQIGEMFRVHRGASMKESMAKAAELLERVGIPAAKRRVKDYPHQFSGGMRQRVTIAMAIALEPDILIADEPTTALDVTVQAQIMGLLAELQRQSGMGLVLITHDLGVVAETADRVAVMYAGKIVESGPTRSLYEHPSHPYTIGLMRSAPNAVAKGSRLKALGGSPPDASHLPTGCAFHPRCFMARDACRTEVPVIAEFRPPQASACHYREEVVSLGA